MNYYYHHIGDFKKDTAFLTHHQRSVYLELIWLYYDQEEPLTKDLDLLALKVQSTKEEVTMLLKLFFYEEEDHFRHSRIDDELGKMYDKSEKARQNVQKRWDKQKVYGRNTNVILPNTQDPIPNTQSIKPKKDFDNDDDFQKFWIAYDYKVGIVKAYEVWKEKKCVKDLEKILTHIKYYHTTREWTEGFKKHPRTYLNQKMYLDPIQKSKVKNDWDGAK